MSYEIVIPIDRETLTLVGDQHRARAYNYVRYHLKALEVTVTSPSSAAGEPWCKADAVALGMQAVDSDVVIVHDADVVVHLRALEMAVAAVLEEKAAWAIPHWLVHRLDQDTSNVVMKTGVVPSTTRQLVRHPYVGMPGGGIVVLRSDVYTDCPLDPRFKGWGSEDQSWGWALECLHGQPWRGDADLFHLFHPHPEPHAQRSPLRESELLRRAYRAYRNRPERMRELVDGARVASE